MNRIFIFLIFISFHAQSQIVPFSFVKKTFKMNETYSIVSNGLSLYLDASINTSYPGSGDGSTWYDLSPSGGHALLYGQNFGNLGFDGSSANYSNLGGGAIYFSGGAYGDIINSKLNNTAYTKQVWVNIDNLGWFNNIISGDGGSSHYLYPVSTTLFKSGNGFPWPIEGNTPISQNTWINIVVTFDTINGWNMYFNGNLDASNSNEKNPPSGPGKMYLGAYAGDFTLSGYIAQALVYNRALTATEVLQNFNATKTRFGF